MDLQPSLVMAVWTAGIAAGAASVAWSRIVGPGYVWMTGATVAGFGVFAGVIGGGWLAWTGTAFAIGATFAARHPSLSTAGLGAAAISFGAVALADSPWWLVLTGATLIGGITSEMLLGHWYLVDPTLPRSALRRLVVAAGIGLVADIASLAVAAIGNGSVDEPVFAWAWIALGAMTTLLLVGVWFSLKEPRYTGVMAATGLSYLAVLTGIGVLVVGRIVAYG